MTDGLTLAPVVERLRRDFGAVRVATRTRDGQLRATTYADVAARATRLAEALVAAGLRPGDRVATLMANHATHLEAILGIPLCGGVVHALNPRLPEVDLLYVMADAEDRFLLVDHELTEPLAPVLSRARLERVIPVGGPHDEYEDLLATASGDYVPPELDERAPLGVCYTSGTTGRPKGLVHSHRATILHSLAVGMVDGFGMSRHDVVLSVVPFFHAHAIGFPYAAAVLGAAQVLPGGVLDPDALLDLIEREQVSFTGGLATSWAALADAIERAPARPRLPASFRIVAGGNALPSSLIERLARLGIGLVHTWGMTETGPLSTISRDPSAASVPAGQERGGVARQGVAAPLVRVRVADADGVELAWDDRSVGELQVRGPWITGSYLRGARSRDRDPNEGFTADGWLRTGDLCVIDAQGSVRLVDRLKDVIRVGEEWVSSTAIEDALSRDPALAEVAVVAIVDLEHGELPLAVLVSRAEPRPTAAQLRARVPAELLPREIPMPVVFTDAIPRAPTGKVDKKALRNSYADGSLGDVHRK